MTRVDSAAALVQAGRRGRADESAYRLLVLPFLVALFLLVAAPIISAFGISLSSLNLTKLSSPEFVGLENYQLLLRDPRFWNDIGVWLSLVFGATVLQLGLGLALALALTGEDRFVRFCRAAFILPMVLPEVVVGLVWKLLLMPTYGGLNQALRVLGVPEIPWLTASSLALPTVTGVVIWEWTPFVMLLLVASLQSLPQEPFEAAQVDGANTWQVFRHITLPLLSPAILFVAVFRIIESLKVFPVIYVLTGGGPGTTTEPINYYAYLLGFSYSRMGEAATVIVMIFLFVLAMSVFMIAWRANPTGEA